MKKEKEKKKKAFQKTSRETHSFEKEGRHFVSLRGEKEELGEVRVSIRDFIAPNGVNPNPLDYMILDDGGRKVYAMTLYIDNNTKSATFATTYEPLLSFPGVTTTIYIDAIKGAKIAKLMDHRILILDAELIAAKKNGDTNRVRKIADKMADTTGWARDVEQGYNSFFEVAFVFTLMDEDFDRLRMRVNDFHSQGLEKGISLSGCYATHPEGFLATAPSSRLPRLGNGFIGILPVKKHKMDKFSLACIYPHIRTDFSHRDGVVLGRNLYTGQPFLLDVYDPASNGFGLVASGMVGVGKSATIKMYASRYLDFDHCRGVSIDVESRGNTGEYGAFTKSLGGVNFQISGRSSNRLNLFEVNEEVEFDEDTSTEFSVLRLNATMTNIRHILMTMVVDGAQSPEFVEAKAIRKILGDGVAALYEDLGIIDGDVESLYTAGSVISQGVFTSGKLKKNLPTMHSFYMKLLQMQQQNLYPHHKMAYNVVLDALSDYVEDLCYCSTCLREYRKEEYVYHVREREEGEQGVCQCGGTLISVKGMRPYFDGVSTMTADITTPWVNVDISQLPEVDKPMAQLIGLNYLNENFVKRNSANPKQMSKLIMLIDEIHKTFPYPEARKLIADIYRTARKRFVSPWSITQAVTDFLEYAETKAIVKNSSVQLIFKQDGMDKEYLEQIEGLTSNHITRILSLGGESDQSGKFSDARKGEVCIVCNDRATFVKVDYLKTTESYVVETDMRNVQRMYQGGHQ